MGGGRAPLARPTPQGRGNRGCTYVGIVWMLLKKLGKSQARARSVWFYLLFGSASLHRSAFSFCMPSAICRLPNNTYYTTLEGLIVECGRSSTTAESWDGLCTERDEPGGDNQVDSDHLVIILGGRTQDTELPFAVRHFVAGRGRIARSNRRRRIARSNTAPASLGLGLTQGGFLWGGITPPTPRFQPWELSTQSP